MVIGTDAGSKAAFVAQAKALDQLLAKDGWKTTGNSASTLGKWFEDVASGKDWYPDVDSYKSDAHARCALAFNVAYSNPKPPAFTIRMSCSSPVLGAGVI